MGTLLSSISDDRCPEGMRGTTIEWVSARVLRDVFQCPYPCYDRRDLVAFGVLQRLFDALSALDRIPSATESVATLVKALHILKPPDDDHDLSFTDRRAPFSAFVSVPLQARRETPWRIAESILHEAMHLQLDIVESIVPLASETDRTYYAPWKNEMRSVMSMIHGTYAFFCINRLIILALESTNDACITDYLVERRKTLRQQFLQMRSFARCDALTTIGAAFVSRMISEVLADLPSQGATSGSCTGT